MSPNEIVWCVGNPKISISGFRQEEYRKVVLSPPVTISSNEQLVLTATTPVVIINDLEFVTGVGNNWIKYDSGRSNLVGFYK
jgi:hypothetical protein